MTDTKLPVKDEEGWSIQWGEDFTPVTCEVAVPDYFGRYLWSYYRNGENQKVYLLETINHVKYEKPKRPNPEWLDDGCWVYFMKEYLGGDVGDLNSGVYTQRSYSAVPGAVARIRLDERSFEWLT